MWKRMVAVTFSLGKWSKQLTVDIFVFNRHILRSVDLETQKYVIHVDIPALRIEAEYHVDGKILLMPIRGHGDMVANMSRFF